MINLVLGSQLIIKLAKAIVILFRRHIYFVNIKGGKEMKVSLVQASPNAAKMVADIASICYGKEEAQNPDKLLKHLFKEKHHSVLEHVYFTFYIEGISRACLAQLTRHRHTSPTVESQRYVDQSDSQVVLPDTIRDNPEALRIFNEAVQDARETYL